MKNVSVIVPVYNTERYLRRCIDSLLNQTLPEIEIIAVDDGSTDTSPAILDEYAAKHDNVIVFHKENGGQASARNLALRHCTGEYIGFLDSDDHVKPEMYERLYTKAKTDHLDYVGCGYCDFTYDKDGNDVILSGYHGHKVSREPREMYRFGDVCPFINFYRQDIVKEAGAYFPEGLIYEDTAFFAQLIPFIHSIGFIEEVLAYRLLRANSTITITKPEKVAQIFKVIESLIDFYESHEIMEQYRDELEYFCIRILFCSSLERISSVSGFWERQKLVKQTVDSVHKWFPDYKCNAYFSNSKKDIYMKASNRFIVGGVCEILHLKPKKAYL